MTSVRLATLMDLSWLRLLRNRNTKYFKDSGPVGAEQHLAWWLTLKYPLYILVDGRRRIGTFGIRFRKDELSLANVLIDEKYRGRGYFKKIMEYVDTRNKKNKPVILIVRADNQNAIKVYEKVGFVPKFIQMQR